MTPDELHDVKDVFLLVVRCRRGNYFGFRSEPVGDSLVLGHLVKSISPQHAAEGSVATRSVHSLHGDGFVCPHCSAEAVSLCLQCQRFTCEDKHPVNPGSCNWGCGPAATVATPITLEIQVWGDAG